MAEVIREVRGMDRRYRVMERMRGGSTPITTKKARHKAGSCHLRRGKAWLGEQAPASLIVI